MKKMERYRFLDHTADAKFQAFGATLEEAFANAALAVASLMWDWAGRARERPLPVRVEGRDLEQLLYNFWRRSSYLFETRNFLLAAVEDITIEEDDEGTAWRPIFRGDTDPAQYEIFGEVKAVTYNEMRIEDKAASRWRPSRGRPVRGVHGARTDQRQYLGDPQAGGDEGPGLDLRLRKAPRRRQARQDPGAGAERRLPAGHPDVCPTSCPTPIRATGSRSAGWPPSTWTRASSRREAWATTSTAGSGCCGRTSRKTTSGPGARSFWPRSSRKCRPGWARAA